MPETLRRTLRSHEALLAAVIVVACLALALATDSFFTLRNLQDLFTSNAYTAILCCGLVVVLIAGGIDISFAAIASVVQYVAFSIIRQAGDNWISLFIIAGVLGLLCGVFNALLLYRFRISSIIATIATLNLFYGLLMFFSGGKYISALPPWFGNGITLFQYVDEASRTTYRINLQIILVLVTFALTFFILEHTNTGRQIYAMGGNQEAARRTGLNVWGLHLFVYGYMGCMAAMAGLAQAQLAQSVVPSSLVGTELNVLAAVVLGGASLTGGRGSALGAFLGVALLAILQNGLVLLGVSSYWVQVFNGAVILIAASLTALKGSQVARVRGAAHV
jgi:simple sugar transport system permease protein